MNYLLAAIALLALGKALRMSASLDRLKTAATAAEGLIVQLKASNADLAAQLAAAQAAAGTPDSELDAVSDGLERAVNPEANSPAVTP